jgi:catechol 2,3-dioxygenase-like lactoylglutathione lyase family enzyme
MLLLATSPHSLTTVDQYAILIDKYQSIGGMMSRVQLALNVSDLDSAIAFYSKFFDAEPAKIRSGYANFAIVDPPLKVVLIEGAGQPGSLNHLGVEVFSVEEVLSAASRFSDLELETHVEESTTCCFAVQDKVWVDGPDGSDWEVYTVLADSDSFDGLAGDAKCCVSTSETTVPISADACC